MLTDEQKASLAAPLSAAYVKERRQAGRRLSYLEGWHVIAEANRIFGFDGWTRQTVDIHVVSEHQRKIGVTETFVGKDGWGVSYVAKVRVTVGDVVREGVGAGHGIDVDLGQAHESAIKEAETDAMKRALMTFGNPFGLALYDKTQENVDRAPTPQDRPKDRPQVLADSTMTERCEIVEKALVSAKTSKDIEGIWLTMDNDMKAIFRARVIKLGNEAKDRERGKITIESGRPE